MTGKKIRVMWLCASAIRKQGEAGPARGCWTPWVYQLHEALRVDDSFEWCLVNVGSGIEANDWADGNSRYVSFSGPRRLAYWWPTQPARDKILELMVQWRPDIIHVHGTESFYGLLPPEVGLRSRTVISLQGYLSHCARHMLAGLSPGEIIRAERLRDLTRMSGMIGNWYAFNLSRRIEARVLNSADHFAGRTRWDREIIRSRRPEATYHEMGELLRTPFWKTERMGLRRGLRDKYRIYFSNLAGPHKGGHTLLEALKCLSRGKIEIELRISGRARLDAGYGRAFQLRAESLGVWQNVKFLGELKAEDVARELADCDLFVSSSLSDNSPNSLAEAQLVGAPIVASGVGGVPEMLGNGRLGEIVSPADPWSLAAGIRASLESPEGTVARALLGREEARRRHDPQRVVQQVLTCYERVHAASAS
jgi:glycosyltransferase involved in cell wall biosynthesis